MQTVNAILLLNQGADFTRIFLVPGLTVGNPLNLTGYSFKGQIRSSTDPNAPLLAEFVFTILDQTALTGQVQWSLAKAVINAIPASVVSAEMDCRTGTPYLFDVTMTDSLGFSTRLFQGKCFISPTNTYEVV